MTTISEMSNGLIVVSRRPMRAEDLKRGDRVVHVDYGPGTITRVRNVAVWMRCDDSGIEGTVIAELLRREVKG